MIYSNDGLIFMTRDHYRTFTQASIGIFRTFVEVERGNIPLKTVNDLPVNARDIFNKQNEAGWKGNVAGQTEGTKAGGIYRNIDKLLPTIDSKGNPITYREFDINNKIPGVRRGGERFVVGSDGSVFFTNEHYRSFYRIID